MWILAPRMDQCLKKYEPGTDQLRSSSAEQFLGVLVDSGLHSRQQCAMAGKKANSTLGYVNKSAASWSRDLIICLFAALVRLHLEYFVQFGALHDTKDVNKLEWVQWMATKIIGAREEGLEHLPFKEMLKDWDLFLLEMRQLWRGPSSSSPVPMGRLLRRWDQALWWGAWENDRQSS